MVKQETFNVLVGDCKIGAKLIEKLRDEPDTNLKKLVRVGTFLNIRDFSPSNIDGELYAIQKVNRYLNKEFPDIDQFSEDTKFNIIVLDANELSDWGIEFFRLNNILENFGKENCKLIITKCRTCNECNMKIKNQYPDVNIEWVSHNPWYGTKAYTSFLLEKIREKLK